jgi:hypothetical protein
MHKIDLKLSESQLGVLVYSFGTLSTETPSQKEVRMARSILDKTAIKFKKKYIEISHQSNLFNKTKKHKFTLEYFEAYHLESFAELMYTHPLSDYDRNVIGFIKNTLNQKLA